MTAPNILPRSKKLAYGLGSASIGIKDHGFNTLLMLYYNQVIGLPASWAGTAILIATLIDAIAAPVIGHSSDKLHSRWGRRHPYMYAAALPIALGYLLVWSPPDAGPVIQFSWLLLTSILVRVAISAYEIPSAALTAEFTQDYDERTSLASYRMLFQAVGLVGMGVLAFKVFLKPTDLQSVGQLNAEGYVTYGLIAAVVMLVCVMSAARGTHSQIPYLRTPTTNDELGGLKGLFSGLRILFSDRPYLSVVFCIFFFAVATGLSTALGVYVSTYFWQLNANQLGTVAAAAGGSVVAGLLLALLSRRIGKKSLCIALFTTALTSMVLPVALGLTGLVPQNSSMLSILVLQNFITFSCIFGALIMGASMIADVSDHFELKTGDRMEGLMFAALVMINKAVSGVGVFLSGIILSSIQFPEKAIPGSVPPAVLDALGSVYIISLIVLVGLALFSLSFYPISRTRHEQTIKQLQQRGDLEAAPQ